MLHQLVSNASYINSCTSPPYLQSLIVQHVQPKVVIADVRCKFVNGLINAVDHQKTILYNLITICATKNCNDCTYCKMHKRSCMHFATLFALTFVHHLRIYNLQSLIVQPKIVIRL